MPRRIHILPDIVANQIAAGEVVERPASVVKELVENALDAGARTIQVLVETGGKQRIRVSDDGAGMGREDALLSLDRHATSKIAEAGDLARVATFGFRGEALPSIAAVSRLTLETCEAGETVGTAVRVEGGTILSVQDFPRQAGTTVDVRNLFFNAPARRKFLKAASAETRAINDALCGLALANPSVAFRFLSGQRVLLDLPTVEDVASRIAALWGRESVTSLLSVVSDGHGVSLRGLIQRPDAAGPGFRRTHLFVNGRPFRSPPLLRAADRGYRTTIASGQRPWLFLYLQVSDGLVDVNVHPTKLEVRFEDGGRVEALVEEGVRAALAGADSSAELDSEPTPSKMAVREGQPVSGGGTYESQMALFLSGTPENADVDAQQDPTEAVSAPSGPSEASRPRLWQVHDTYILAETREGLLIIDQHSAHERVLFHRLMDAFADQGQESQRLLFPLTLKLSAAEVKAVLDLKGILSRAGFEVDEFGGDTLILHSVPNPHRTFDAERCFREMMDELTRGSDLVRSAKNQHERIAMTFACKGAIKAGQRLTNEEMTELFDALFATELPYHDVHGRPTIVRLSSSELERKFGRH
jgi:DNA mismatch repair protein MutL